MRNEIKVKLQEPLNEGIYVTVECGPNFILQAWCADVTDTITLIRERLIKWNATTGDRRK